jgi:hypothetical protein
MGIEIVDFGGLPSIEAIFPFQNWLFVNEMKLIREC